MSNGKVIPDASISLEPLSIEQLEAGLRLMDDETFDRGAFLDRNIDAFRETVIVAIRETVDALKSPELPNGYRVELERQVNSLWSYVEVADEYVAQRARLTTLN